MFLLSLGKRLPRAINTSINPIKAKIVYAPVAMGHNVPPFENPGSLVLMAYCQVFLTAFPNLDHMAHFGFYGNCFRCFLRWLKTLISTETSN